ncbi:MAG: hypothetical protein ACRD3W_02045, partial [Terriglobales bacterium]
MRHLIGILGGFFCAGTIAVSAFAADSGSPAPAPAAVAAHDKIDALNLDFRQLYSSARASMINRAGPLLIASDGKVILLNGTTSKEVQYRPLLFDVLKTVDHVPLAIFVHLAANPGPLQTQQVDQLKALRGKITDAQAQILAVPMPAATAQRQKQMIEYCLRFIDVTLQTDETTPAKLREFVRAMQPSVEANMRDSVELELTGLDSAVKQLRASIKDEDWARVHAVVFVSHMARDQEMHLEYFKRLLDQDAEGNRVVYVDGRFDQQAGVD